MQTARTPGTRSLRQRFQLLSLALLMGALCLAGLLAALSLPASAQQSPIRNEQVSFPLRHPFGTGSDKTVCLAVGDMDGDGDLDIIAGNKDEASSVSLNDGQGNFPPEQLLTFGAQGDTSSLAAGDLDGDGDLDVVLGYGDGSSDRYLNDGTGRLTQGEPVAPALGPGNKTAVALGDINGDGYFDVVLTRPTSETLLLLNDGAARFPISHTLGASSRRAASLALGDLDGNGFLDVILAPATGTATIFYQDANRRVVTRTLGTPDQRIRTITLGDFGGDDKLDILVSLAGAGTKPHVLYTNRGNQEFGTSAAFGEGAGENWSVAAGDLNGDGLLDLAVGIGYADWINRIRINAEPGGLVGGQTYSFGPPSQATRAVALADVNGDGLLDVLTGNEGRQNIVYLRGQTTAFSVADLDPVDKLPTDMTSGDLNADNQLDLVIAYDGAQNAVLWGDATAESGYRAVNFGPLRGHTRGVAVADLNGDQHPDIVTGNANEPSLIYFDAAKSLFDVRRTVSFGRSEDTRSVAVADLNGDGALDIVAGNFLQPDRIYFNDGLGNFPEERATTFDPQPGKTLRVKIGQMNGDEWPDIVVGYQDRAGTVFLNRGDGTFTPRPFGADDLQAWSLALGDFNGDGATDAVVTSVTSKHFYYVNDNQGNLTAAPAADLQAPATGAVSAWTTSGADLDGDGVSELVWGYPVQAGGQHGTAVAGQDEAGKVQLYVNKGGGWNPIPLPSGARENVAVALGDVNGDGKLDIVCGNMVGDTLGHEVVGNNTVFVNQGSGRFSVESFGLADENTWAVALADVDRDGALDVIAGNIRGAQHAVYFNDGAGHFPLARRYPIPDPISVAAASYANTSLATGDLDGAHGVDLVACSSNHACSVYLNDGAGRFSPEQAFPLGDAANSTAAVAIADLDGDGAQDIVLGNLGARSQIYLNNRKGQFPEQLRRSFGLNIDYARALAVADMNGDRQPDILVGHFFGSGALYLNDGQGNFPDRLAQSFGQGTDRTYSIATGDVNGDGYMDFVAGNWGTAQEPGQNVLYLNERLGSFAAMPLRDADWTRAVALGDVDGNGAMDVIEGNRYGDQRLRIHYNRLRESRNVGNWMPTVVFTHPVTDQNAALFSLPHGSDTPWIPFAFTLRDPESETVGRVVVDYSLDGGSHWTPVSTRITDTLRHLAASPAGVSHQIAWNVGNVGVVGRSDNTVLRIRAYTQPDQPDAERTYRYTDTIPALHQWPVVTVSTVPFSLQGTAVAVYSGTLPYDGAAVYRLPAGEERGAEPLGGLAQPYRTESDGFLPGRAEIKAGATVTESDRLVAVWPAAAVTTTTPTQFYASSAAFPMTVTAGAPRPARASLLVSDARRVAAIHVWTDISATLPISVALRLVSPRGDRIMLLDGLLPAGESLCGPDETREACGAAARQIFTPTLTAPPNPLADGTWTLEVSSPAAGSFQWLGWGLALKLSPLNFTSAKPTTSGLEADAVTAGRVQTLTVSSANPLLLFDLNVALEWNASNDDKTLARLSADLRRASELMYDWTNGQIALGNVGVYHDARRNTLPDGTNAWNNAHIRIYATNRLRPNADQGGAVSQAFSETVKSAESPGGAAAKIITYLPGQVRMGAIWNRYGDATAGNLGDDWPAALAHELGHYLLFLDDNYLTVQEEDNLLIPLDDDDCPGAMNNPYSNAYSEFHPEQGWNTPQTAADGRCERTLSELNTGRSDWETIKQFYPDVVTPTGVFTEVLSGPSLLPLAVTQITFHAPDPASDPMTWLAQLYGRPGEAPESVYRRFCAPQGAALPAPNLALTETGAPIFECPTKLITSTQPLGAPIFYLKRMPQGETIGSQARVFLFQGLPYPTLIDLGQPIGDQVVAPGARPNDRLCVYDLAHGRVGCEAITPGDDQLEMQQTAGWQPQIIVAPETTRTLQISVTLPNIAANSALTLTARLYPMDGPAPAPVTMTQLGCMADACGYLAALPTAAPVLEGYVLVGESPGLGVGSHPRQAVAEFAIGGNPVRIRAFRTPTDPRSVRIRAFRVRIRAFRAPAASVDGQVMVYPDETTLPADTEWSFTLQPATRLPAEIPWATPVGRAYWLTASDNIADFGRSSITFEYLRSDVPAGEAAFIRMYFWDETTQSWAPLPNQENFPEYNLISARLTGPGLYALFSHYDIPLRSGWNLIGYPVQGTRPITEALASIRDKYSLVFGFDDAGSPADPWPVYVPPGSVRGEDGWVNDLQELRFGRGYWIYVSAGEGAMLHLKGNPQTTQPLTSTLAADALRNPPAVYFGKVVQSDPMGFAPSPGLVVKAYVGAVLCGEARLDGELRYVVKVRAASVSEMGCGSPGAPVSFRIAGLPSVTLATGPWDNGVPHRQDLPLPAGSANAGPVSPAVCRELVRAGDFEADGNWRRLVTDTRGRVIRWDAEHGRVLLLGVLPNEAAPKKLSYSTAFQNGILLPASASTISLSFSVQTDAREGGEGRVVQIYRGDWTYPPIAALAIAGSEAWHTLTLDLTPLRGQMVNLYFEVANAGRRPTQWMAIDDVSVTACE